MSDSFIEAITTIAQAPLPVLVTSTSKYGRITHVDEPNDDYEDDLPNHSIKRVGISTTSE